MEECLLAVGVVFVYDIVLDHVDGYCLENTLKSGGSDRGGRCIGDERNDID